MRPRKILFTSSCQAIKPSSKLLQYHLEVVLNCHILEVSLDSYITNNRKDLLISLQKNNLQKLLDNTQHPICSKLRKELSWPIESVQFKEYRYDADVREGLKNKEKLVNSVFDLT